MTDLLWWVSVYIVFGVGFVVGLLVGVRMSFEYFKMRYNETRPT